MFLSLSVYTVYTGILAQYEKRVAARHTSLVYILISINIYEYLLDELHPLRNLSLKQQIAFPVTALQTRWSVYIRFLRRFPVFCQHTIVGLLS
jgi:hypothetical protein